MWTARHIRTLLLTFFYRHMKEVIQRGYLYIAQPPLFRVQRGRNEVYKKDERELDDYLIDEGLRNARLLARPPEAREERAGADLRALVLRARDHAAALRALARRGDAAVIAQAAVAGALDPALADDREAAQAAAARVAERPERAGPRRARTDGRARWTRTARRCWRRAAARGGTRAPPPGAGPAARGGGAPAQRRAPRTARTLHAPRRSSRAKGERTGPLASPVALFDAVLAIGRARGFRCSATRASRMNPDQLWETTLDAEARTLLQVRVEHADNAEDLFSTLMGDLVEPRRAFIQENALNVANLDV